MKGSVIFLSFLLMLGSQSTVASASVISQRAGGPPSFTLAACWLTEGWKALPHEDCNKPWYACLADVEAKFGPPKLHGIPQTDGSQPFYDKCDRARRQCEAKYC